MTTRRPWLLPAGLLLLVALLLAFDIGGRAISSPTEARYVQIPLEMLRSGDFVLPRLDGVMYLEKPPLFYWLQAASLSAFGFSEWSARLSTAIFTFICCVTTGAAAWRLYGRATALAAAAILATTVFFYANGRFVQTDMVVSLFIVATMFLFLVGAQEPDRRLQVWLFRGAWLAAAFAVLSKGLIGIVLPGLVVFVWIALTGQWRLIGKFLIPSGIVIFLAVSVPWHVAAAMRNDDFLWFYFVHEHFLRFTTKVHGRVHPLWFFVPIVLFGFLPWTGDMIVGFLRAIPRRRAALRADPVGLFLVLWSVLIFVFFSASDSKLAPYVLPIFPSLAVLAGRIVGPGVAAGTGGSAFGRWTFVGLFGIAGVALLVAPHLPTMQARPEVAAANAIVGPYLVILAATLLAGAFAVAVLSRLGRTAATVPVMVVVAALGWTTLSLGASALSPNTVKPLALMIRDRLQPGDVVASVGKLFYDLPVYLGSNVVVVDTMAEFHFGATQEDIGKIAIGHDEFRRRWDGPEHIYALVQATKFAAWPPEQRARAYVIGRTDRVVAVTNRPSSP